MARTSSRELTEWDVYEREFGPLGPERGDYQAAMVAYTTAAVMGGGKRRPKLTEFLLRWTRRRQTAEEQLGVFKALAARQEGLTRVDNR